MKDVLEALEFDTERRDPSVTDVGNDFAGVTASHYATYRRDVPDVLIEAVVRAAELTDDDIALDLGCGTGQVSLPLARHVGLVVAVDPEPAMLAGLRVRATATKGANVLPVLAADRELPLISNVWAASLGAVTVGNALHWMDTRHVFAQSRALLRVGGALVIISQGPPMWLSDADWSRDLRAFLERWTGGTVSATCGTDRGTLERRARGLGEHGYERVEIVEHAYENEVDLTYIAGHLRSAMPESTLPREREAEFRDRLKDSLRPHLRTGAVTERIESTALIGVAPTASSLSLAG